jgi:hypothetical protein
LQLVCKYEGTDGVIVVDYPDTSSVDMSAYPGCVLIRHQESVDSKLPDGETDRYPKVGELPDKLGDAPTDTYPDHEVLNEEGVPQTVVGRDGVERPHPLRLKAGLVYTDRRQPPRNDFRERRAPSQSDPAVIKAYAEWACEASLARGVVIDGVRYAADSAGSQVVESRALRAARDPKFTVKAQAESGEVKTLNSDQIIKVADGVSDFVSSRADLMAEIDSKISGGSVRSFADVDAELGG